MKGSLTYSPEKKGIPNEPLSAYQPSQEISDIFAVVKNAYELGDEVLNRPFRELNDKSVIQRANEDQQAWLSWNPGGFTDVDSEWRWSGVRPITRNKVISTAAHLTAQLIKPTIFAQNDQDEEDKDASYVMGSLLDYNIQRTDYELAFLYGVLSALVNPVSYFEVEYAESYQELNNKKKPKKVIDDELSGFQFYLRPVDEILIPNPYQFHIQKQDFLISRRRMSYEDAEAIHGEHDNWIYVQRGLHSILGEDGMFYDIEDIDGDSLVEEVTYRHRRQDVEVVSVNNIYLSNENVKNNPIKHRTNKDKPKYPIVKLGAEPIDAMRFFFYKSLVAKMSNDQELYDRMWQLSMDATFLATMTPVVTIGAGRIDQSVIVPGLVTPLPAGAEVKPLSGIVNPAASFAALREAENALSESSQDPQTQGQQGNLPQTARQSILIQQNAETNLSLLSRMIGYAAKEVGELMIDDIIRYQTTGQVNEVIAGTPRLKFKSFILGGKVKEGKSVTDHIRFTDRFAGQEMTPEQKETEELRLFQEAGEDKAIFEINPLLFARLDYLITIDYEQMTKKNTSFERAFKLEVYDRLISNPFVDQISVTRDFLLEPLVKGEASKYIKQAEALIPQQLQPEQGRANGRLSERMMQSQAMQSQTL